jgi:hypothetical protein
MAMAGLVEADLELESAVKAFRKWRKEELGWVSQGGDFKDSEEDVAFRKQMKELVAAVETGQDWRKTLAAMPDKGKVVRSMAGKALLRAPDNSPLTAEQSAKLRKAIGDEAYGKLEARDAMLRELARTLGVQVVNREVDTAKLPELKGEMMVDRVPEGRRIERLETQLGTATTEWMKTRQLKLSGYEPTIMLGGKKTQLTAKEGAVLERLVLAEYRDVLDKLQASASTKNMPDKRVQEMLSMRLKAARERAAVKARKELQK